VYRIKTAAEAAATAGRTPISSRRMSVKRKKEKGREGFQVEGESRRQEEGRNPPYLRS